MGTAARRDALAALLPGAGVDALVVTALVNVRYLTGFTGSNAALLVTADGEAVLWTDGRYRTQAAAEVPDLEIVIDRPVGTAAVRAATGRGIGMLGFESEHVSVDEHAEWTAAAPGVCLVRAPGLPERLRQVKDADELALLRRAAALADTAFGELLAAGGVTAGRTERAVASDLDARMRELGADGPGFATIVGAGPHSAIPHHQPGATPLAPGDLVTFDFGALVAGYHSDMTRMVVLGRPAGWQRELYDLVETAYAAGRAALVPGVGAAELDAAARDVITAAGYGETEFGHGLGHGVGLQIHEAPWLNARAGGIVAGGTVVTVEPGVYLAGRGGVRIEDTLHLGESGPVALTCFPRELVEI